MNESTINFNPAKFAGGVAKSFVSATKSTIASYMPFTSELLQDASDTAFDIRSYINENRPDKTSRNSSGILRTFTNKVYNTSKNFLSDLSHGNLSLDRTRQGLTDYIKKNTQSEFDFDFDFDFDDEDNGEMPEAESFTAEDYAQGVYESTMATVGAIEISTNKLAFMNAKSNTILGDRLIATEMSNMAQSMQMLNTVNDNISGINENLASLIEYNNTTMNDFIKNTAVHFNKVEQFMDMVAKHYGETKNEDNTRKNEEDTRVFKDSGFINFGNLFKKAITTADIEFNTMGMIGSIVKLAATSILGPDGLPKFLQDIEGPDLSMLIDAINPAKTLANILLPELSKLSVVDRNIKGIGTLLRRKLQTDKGKGGFFDSDNKIGSFLLKLFGDETEYKFYTGPENKQASWMTSDSEVLQHIIPMSLNEANVNLKHIQSNAETISKLIANVSRELSLFHEDSLRGYSYMIQSIDDGGQGGGAGGRKYGQSPKAEKAMLDLGSRMERTRNRRIDQDRTNKNRKDKQKEKLAKYDNAQRIIFDSDRMEMRSYEDVEKDYQTAKIRAYSTGKTEIGNEFYNLLTHNGDIKSLDEKYGEGIEAKINEILNSTIGDALVTENAFVDINHRLDSVEITREVFEKLEELGVFDVDKDLNGSNKARIIAALDEISAERLKRINKFNEQYANDTTLSHTQRYKKGDNYSYYDRFSIDDVKKAMANPAYASYFKPVKLETDDTIFEMAAYAQVKDAEARGIDTNSDEYKRLMADSETRLQGMKKSMAKKKNSPYWKLVIAQNPVNKYASALFDTVNQYLGSTISELISSEGNIFEQIRDAITAKPLADAFTEIAYNYDTRKGSYVPHFEDGQYVGQRYYSPKRWGQYLEIDSEGNPVGGWVDDPEYIRIKEENEKEDYEEIESRHKFVKTDDNGKEISSPRQYSQPTLFGFATGATRINADQIARVHEGEMILDKSLSQEVRDDIVTMLNNGGYNSMSEEWQQKLLKAIGDSDERFKGHEMEVVKAVNRVVDRYSPETIKSMALRPSDESLCFIDIDENDDPASILVKKLTEMSINLGIMTQTALGTTERENRERGFEKTGKAKNLLLGDKGEGDLRHGGLLSDAYNQIVDDVRYKRFMYIDGKKYTGYTRDEAGNIIEGAGLKSYHATGENATETKNIMDELRAKAKENAFAYAESQRWSNDQTWAYVKTVDSLVQGIPGAVKGGLIGLTLSGVLGSAIGIMSGFTLGNKDTREYIFGKVETDSNGRKYVSGGIFGGFTNRLIEAGEDIKTNFKSAFSDVTNNLKLGFKSFLKRITNSNEDSVGNGIAKFLEQVVTGKDGTIVTRFLNSLKNTVGKVAEGATDIAIDAVTIGSKLMFKAASVPFNVFASIIGGKEYRAAKKSEKRAARSKQLKDIYNELIFNDSLIGINPEHDITKMFPKIKDDVKNKFNNIKGGVISGWTSWQNRLAEENETYKKFNRTRHILGKGGYLSDLPSNIANGARTLGGNISSRWNNWNDRLGYINEHYYKAQGKLPHLFGRGGMIDDYIANPLKRFGASAVKTADKVKEKGKTVFDKMSEGISSIGKALTGEYGQSILRGLAGIMLATPLAITGHPILAGSVLAAGTANAIFKQILGTGMLGIFSTGLKAVGGRAKSITKPIGEFIGNRVHALKERLGIDDSKFYFRRMMRGSHIDRGGMLSDLGYTTEEQQRYFELMKKDPSELTPDERMFINGIQNSVSTGHRATSDDEEAQRVLNEESEYKVLKNKKDLTPEEKARLKELTATVGDRKWFRFKRDNGLTDFAIKHGRGKSALKKLNNLSLDDFNLAKSSLDFKSSLSSRITPEMFASMGITDTGKMNKIQAEADKELKKLRNSVIKRFGSLDAAMDYPDELRAMIMQSGFDKNEQALDGKTAKEMIAFLRNGDTQSIIQEQNFRDTLLNVVPVMGQTITDIYEGLKKAFFEKKPDSGDLYHKQNEDMATNAFNGENYSTAEHTSDELKDKLKESLANPEKETNGVIDKISDAYEDVKDVMKPGVDYSDIIKQIGSPEVSSSIPEAGGELITNAFQLIPAKASGATNIDVDGLYKLHKGEIVLDPESANSFRRNIGTGGLDSNELSDISASLRVLSGRDVKKPNKLFNLFGGDDDEKEGGIKGIFSSMKEKLGGLLNVFTGDKTGSDEEKKSFLDKIGESFAGVGQKISGAVMGSGLIPLKPDGTIDTGKLAARALALLGGIVLFGPAVLKIINKLAPLLQPIFDTITTTIQPLIFGENGKGGLINGISEAITNAIRAISGAQDGETTIHAIGRGIHEAWVHVGGAIFENTPTGKQLGATQEDNSVNQNSKDFAQIKSQIEKDVETSGISSDTKSKYLNDILNNQPMFISQLSEYYANITKFGAAYASAKNLDDVSSLPFGNGAMSYIEASNSETIKTGVKNYLTSDEYAYVEKYSIGTNVYDKEAFTKVAQNLTNVKLGYSSDTKSWYIKEYASKEDAERFSKGKASRVKQGLSILVKRNNKLVKAYNALMAYGNSGATGISGDVLNFVDSVFNKDNTVLNPVPAKSYEELSSDDEVNLNAYGNVGYGYTQNDPRWARQSYGSFKSGRGSTIGSGGCGPTAMANVYSNLTGRKVNPGQMARFSQSNGYNAQGGTSAGLFTNGARKLGLASRAISKSGNAIGNSIRHGNNVVIAGKNGPYTRAGHIMSVKGVDSRGNAIVDDPLKRGARRIPMNRLTKGMTHAWSIGRGPAVGYGTGTVGGQTYQTWDDMFTDGTATYNRNGGSFGYVGGYNGMANGCVYNSFVNGYLNAALGNESFEAFIKEHGWSPASLHYSKAVTQFNGVGGVVDYDVLGRELSNIIGKSVGIRYNDLSNPESSKMDMNTFFSIIYDNLKAGKPILFSVNSATPNGENTSTPLGKLSYVTASYTGNIDIDNVKPSSFHCDHGILLAGLHRDASGKEYVVMSDPGRSGINQVHKMSVEKFADAVKETDTPPYIRRVVVFDRQVGPSARYFVKQKPEDMFKAMKTAAASNDAASEAFLKTFPDGNKYDTYSAWASAHPDLAKKYSEGMSSSNIASYASGGTATTGTAYTPMAANYDSGNIFASGLTQNMNAGGSKDAKSVSEWIANLISDLTDFGFNLIGSIISGDKSLLYSSSKSSGSYSGGYSGGYAAYTGGSGGSGGTFGVPNMPTVTAQTVIDEKFIDSLLEAAADAYHDNAEVNDTIKSLFDDNCTINYSKFNGELRQGHYYQNILYAIANSENYKRYVARVSAPIYTWILARHVLKYASIPYDDIKNGKNKVTENHVDRDAVIIYNKIKESDLGFSSAIAHQLNGTSINGLVIPTSSLSGYNALPAWAKVPHGEYKLYDMSQIPDYANVHDYTSAIATIGETGTKFPPTNAEELSRMYFRIYEDNGAPSFGRRGFHFNPSNYGLSAVNNYYPGEAIFANMINSGDPEISEPAQKWFDYITAPGNFHNFPSYPRYTEITGSNKFLSALIQAEDAMNSQLHSEYFDILRRHNPNITDPRIYVLAGDIMGVAPNGIAPKLANVKTLEEAKYALRGHASRVNGVYGMITTGQGTMYGSPWTFPQYPISPLSIGNGDAGYNMRDNDSMYTNDVYMGDADNPMHVVMDSSPVTSRIDKLIELIDSAVNPKELTQAGPSNAKSNSIGHGEPNVAQAPTMSATKGQSSIGQKDRLAQLHSKLAKRTRTNLNYNHL